MKIGKAVIILLFLFAPELHAADKPRKVPCPAQCNAAEEADSTQACTWHDKELYKVDGIGCKKYETVCWCKPKREPLPPKTVL